jgi:hypothetical protein
MEIDSSQQWMMVGTEHPGSAVPRILVEPMDSGVSYGAGAIADKEVIEDQSGQRVKRVPPRRQRRRHAEGESSLTQEPPGSLVSATAQVEIGPKNHGVVRD